jgi:hypothetical protein
MDALEGEQPELSGYARLPEPKERSRMSQEAELSMHSAEVLTEDEVHPYSPGPLVGFITGIALSVTLWLMVGCIALVVRLLSGQG